MPTASMQEAIDFVTQRYPNVRVRYHSDVDQFALWDQSQGGNRISDLFAWQSLCWYNAAEKIELREWELSKDSNKVIGTSA